VRGTGTHVNPERKRRENSRESSTRNVKSEGTHVNQASTSKSSSNLPAFSETGVKNGNFPLKIWSWPWHDLGFRSQGHSKVILNIKFRALSESVVKSRGSYLENRNWFKSPLKWRSRSLIFFGPLRTKQLLFKKFFSILLHKIIEIKD